MPRSDRSLRVFLDRMIHDLPFDSSIRVGDLWARVEQRGFGMIMLLCTVLCMIPLPGPNAILTIPLIIITGQMIAGFKTPWLPKFILNRSVKVNHIHTVFNYLSPFLTRLEKIIRPRYIKLVPRRNLRSIGAISFILAIVIALPIPIPGTNLLPALCVMAISLALLNRDGLVLWGATIVAALFVGKLGLGLTLAWKWFFGP